MIAYPVSRIQTNFPSLVNQLFTVSTQGGTSSSQTAIVSGITSQSGGVSISVAGATNNFNANFSTVGHFYQAEAHGESGGTTSANATMSSFSSSQSESSSFTSIQTVGTTVTTDSGSFTDSFGTSTSGSSDISLTFGTSTNSTFTSNQVTSAATSGTTTHFFVTGKTLSTQSTTATWKTSSLQTTTASTIGVTSSSAVVSTYIEFGNAILSGGDWIWLATNATVAPQFVSQFAQSINSTVIWPVPDFIPVDFAIGGTNASTATVTILANSSTFRTDQLYSSTSTHTTVTIGDLVSRNTTTVSAPVWTTSSGAFSVGNASMTLNELSTSSYSITALLYEACIITATYPIGAGNASTTSFHAVSSRVVTSSQYTVMPVSVTGIGLTVGATNLSYENNSFLPFGSPAVAITPVAPRGAFVDASQLRSGGNPRVFASNLVFAVGQISFPAGLMASVFSNAVTPFPGVASVTDSASRTLLFSWSSETLHATREATALSAGATITTRSTLSGTFGTIGGIGQTYYTDGGEFFGGFQPIDTARETIYFAPRAVLGTSVDTTGGSTTYKTLDVATDSTAISGRLMVELSVPAYYAFTVPGESPFAEQPYLVFPRN